MASNERLTFPASPSRHTGLSRNASMETRHTSSTNITPEFTPMYHVATTVDLGFEAYFKGPRDIHKYSRWPYFFRMHGSVLPRMIIPLVFVGCWAAAVTCITKFVHNLGIDSLLLTVTGFVVALALSFRSSTAYERYSEGRKYWTELVMTSRNLARLIWVHVLERHADSAELGKSDLLAKLAALNLLNAFASALKHRLRFEPSINYPDLAPLISNLNTLAGEADQAALREREVPSWKSIGQYLGIPFAMDNPRKLIKGTKENLGNAPLEILTYLAAYLDNITRNGTLSIAPYQNHAMAQLAALTEVLTNVERVVNTPLPLAYSICISQISWAYVLALPFQLADPLGWIAIPGTIVAGYIILGLAQIGWELEDPFGQDVNDLPLDAFCDELANDIDALTSRPAPLDTNEWMRDGGAKILWPLSELEFKAWEARSVEDIRAALKAKATSRDVEKERQNKMVLSEELTTDA